MPAKTGPSFAGDTACGPAVDFASAVNVVNLVLEFRSPAAQFVLVPSAIFNMRIAKTMDILSAAPTHR